MSVGVMFQIKWCAELLDRVTQDFPAEEMSRTPF